MKEECLWLEEWESLSDVESKLTNWITRVCFQIILTKANNMQ